MRDTLLYGRQCHIVAVGTFQIVLVAHHCLVLPTLELDIYRRGYVRSRETAFQLRTSLRHITDCLCWFCQHNQTANLPLYLAYRKRQILIDQIGQARL